MVSSNWQGPGVWLALICCAILGACDGESGGSARGSGAEGGASGNAGSGAASGAASSSGGTETDAASDGGGALDATIDSRVEAGTSDGGLDGSDTGLPAFLAYPNVTHPPENPFSDAKAMLGKILFWDEQLSSDDTMACGTCHRATSGGSDPRANEALSIHPGPDGAFGTDDDVRGAQGMVRCQVESGAVTYVSDPVFGLNRQVTRRKPPGYLDAMFFPDVFWDGRAKNAFVDPDTGLVVIASGGALESQAVGPPLADAEMACEGRTWPEIHEKLRTAVPLALASNVPADMAAYIADHGASYPTLFAAAFGTEDKVNSSDPDDVINTRRIAFAIATHERRLISDQTPWDRWNAGEIDAMTPAQVHGFEVFMSKGQCNLCHAPPLFTDSLYHNLGFIPSSSFDLGREETTATTADRGAFKTPGLRNVGLREAGGLLHVGRGPGATLEAVVSAYNVPPNLDSNADPLIRLLGLTGPEITDLVAFMRNALTDARVQSGAPPFDKPMLGSEP